MKQPDIPPTSDIGTSNAPMTTCNTFKAWRVVKLFPSYALKGYCLSWEAVKTSRFLPKRCFVGTAGIYIHIVHSPKSGTNNVLVWGTLAHRCADLQRQLLPRPSPLPPLQTIKVIGIVFIVVVLHLHHQYIFDLFMWIVDCGTITSVGNLREWKYPRPTLFQSAVLLYSKTKIWVERDKLSEPTI